MDRPILKEKSLKKSKLNNKPKLNKDILKRRRTKEPRLDDIIDPKEISDHEDNYVLKLNDKRQFIVSFAKSRLIREISTEEAS